MFFFHITALSSCVDPSLSNIALNPTVRTDMKAQSCMQPSKPWAETWHVKCATGGKSKNKPVSWGYSVKQPTAQTDSQCQKLTLKHVDAHSFWSLVFCQLVYRSKTHPWKVWATQQSKNLYGFIIKMPNYHWLSTSTFFSGR